MHIATLYICTYVGQICEPKNASTLVVAPSDLCALTFAEPLILKQFVPDHSATCSMTCAFLNVYRMVTTCISWDGNRSITSHFRIPNTCVHSIKNHQQIRQTLRLLQFKLSFFVVFLRSAVKLFSSKNQQQFRMLCTEIYRCPKPFHIIENMQ